MMLKISLVTLFLSSPLAFGAAPKNVKFKNVSEFPLAVMVVSSAYRDKEDRLKHPIEELAPEKMTHIHFKNIGSLSTKLGKDHNALAPLSTPNEVLIYGAEYDDKIPCTTLILDKENSQYTLNVIAGKIVIEKREKAAKRK